MILKSRTEKTIENLDKTQGRKIKMWRFDSNVASVEIEDMEALENYRKVTYLGGDNKFNMFSLSGEFYLINDEGKTIERLN